MFICKMIGPFKETIFRTEGFDKKAKHFPLYDIEIPPQKIAYSLNDETLISDLFDVKVHLYPLEKPTFLQGVARRSLEIPESAQDAKGSWSLETFADFVSGVKNVIEESSKFISGGDFIAEERITETTYVWSRYREEIIGGGMFSKNKEFVQKVDFEILGLQSGDVQWEPEMFNALISLQSKLQNEIDDFVTKIEKLK